MLFVKQKGILKSEIRGGGGGGERRLKREKGRKGEKGMKKKKSFCFRMLAGGARDGRKGQKGN